MRNVRWKRAARAVPRRGGSGVSPSTTASSISSIEMAVSVYGADKIVFGSDGTHFGMDWSNKAIADSRISDAEKQAILGGNAASAIERCVGRLAVAAQ